jgi:hypothetical protein
VRCTRPLNFPKFEGCSCRARDLSLLQLVQRAKIVHDD